MSTFAKQLRSSITAMQKPRITPIRMSVESTYHHSPLRPMVDKCIVFDINWQQSVWITDDGNLGEKVSEFHKITAERLLEDIYGDFRELLYQLRIAAMEMDHDKVLYLTNQLIKETKGQE